MTAYIPLYDLPFPCFRLRGFTPAEDEADWPILASSELERSFVRLFWDINTQFIILAKTIFHFQSKGSSLNPENVTLVLEEASRRLGEEAIEKDLRTTERKSFKQTVRLPLKLSSFQKRLKDSVEEKASSKR